MKLIATNRAAFAINLAIPLRWHSLDTCFGTAFNIKTIGKLIARVYVIQRDFHCLLFRMGKNEHVCPHDKTHLVELREKIVMIFCHLVGFVERFYSAENKVRVNLGVCAERKTTRKDIYDRAFMPYP